MLAKVIGFSGAILLIVLAKFSGAGTTPSGNAAFTGSGPANAAARVGVEAGADQILIRVSGRVDDTMAADLGAALAGFRYERRPIVISINSVGGYVGAGQQIVDLINVAKSGSDVAMRVGRQGICASMCVPIYLSGSRRSAAPDARFMFHEARLAKNDPGYQKLRQSAQGVLSKQEFASFEKTVTSGVTDGLFGRDMNYRDVNSDWLRNMRARVRGGNDVWLTGQQLVDQGSGVVHVLE